MRGSLIAAALLALATYCGNAQAQTPSDVTGLTRTSTSELSILLPE